MDELPSPADLTEHAAFLRRLARGLVRDEALAEDLVQDTWMASLERPPRERGDLRAWLARVLRNRAHSVRRADESRRARERDVARREAESAGADERLELQGRIVRSLGDLDEASRTALVLRYYEGLGPTAIAERLGVSVNTVKARLARGLARLRERLDRAHGGDRRRWAALLAPVAGLGPEPAAAGGALAAPWILGGVVGTMIKLVSAGLAVAFVALVPWLRSGDRERAAVPPDTVADAAAAEAPGLAPVVPPAEDDARALVARSADDPAPAAAPAAAEPAGPGLPLVRTGGPPDARPAIRVTDARTGRPVELVHVATQTSAEGYPRDGGTFRAPDGLLTRGGRPTVFWMDAQEAFRLTVWADGYEPAVVDVPDFRAPRLVEVRLAPGAAPALRGRVVRAGAPVDALVSLSPFYDLQWEVADLQPANARRTDAAGAFELSAPPGSWILRVQADGTDHARRVELPRRDPLVVDLAELADVAVAVADAGGAPAAGQVVVLRPRPSDGRQSWAETDDAGTARFADLAAGPWEVTLHGTREAFLNTPSARAEPVLTAGAETAVALSLPPEARRVRLVVDGGGDPAAWGVRGFAETEGWEPVASDGRLPVDVSAASWLDLRSPRGAVWRWAVPPWSPGEEELVARVPGDPPAYRGRLSDRVTGEPIAGGAVKSQFRFGDDFGAVVSVRAPVGPDGRFVLPMPDDEVRGLAFEIDGEPVGADLFRPHDRPSRAGELDVRLFRHTIYRRATGVPTVSVSGTVTDAATGEPVREAYVRVRSRFADLDGTLTVGWEPSNGRTSSDGTYRVEVPAADGYELRVSSEWSADARTATEEHGPRTAGDRVTWDVELP